MPFVKLADVEKLLPAGLLGVLRNSPDTFKDLEAFASIIVRDVTARAIPTTEVNAATDWAVMPMAWLIAHAGLSQWDPPEDVRRTVESNRTLAMTTLNAHRAPSTATGLAALKPIIGEVEW